jgi:hypothetical protein
MKEFEFYIEFDGRRSYRLEEEEGERILAGSVEQAVNKFSKRKNLSLESIDELEKGQYRVFFEKRAWLKPSKQVIYFITSFN